MKLYVYAASLVVPMAEGSTVFGLVLADSEYDAVTAVKEDGEQKGLPVTFVSARLTGVALLLQDERVNREVQ